MLKDISAQTKHQQRRQVATLSPPPKKKKYKIKVFILRHSTTNALHAKVSKLYSTCIFYSNIEKIN